LLIETNNADVVKPTMDPTFIIASRNYVDGKVAQVQTALTEHSAQTITQTITISRSIGVNGVQIVSDFIKKTNALIVNTAILDALSSSRSFVNDLNIVMSCFNDGKNQEGEGAVMVGDSSTHHVVATATINNDNTISLNWVTVGTPTEGIIIAHIMALYHGHGGDE